MSSKRVEWVDMARGGAVLLVILGHLCEDLRLMHDLIYTFHMPLFFFLSGYVFKYKGRIEEYILKRAKSLLIPYFILSIILTVISVSARLLKGTLNADLLWQSVKNIVVQHRNLSIWFLPCLFFLNIVFFGIVKLSSDRPLPIMAVSAASAVLGLCYYRYIGNVLIFNLDVIPVALLFFASGYIFKRSRLPQLLASNKIAAFITLLISAAAAFVLEELNHRATGFGFDMFLSRYGKPFFTIPAAFAGICFFISFSMLIKIPFVMHIGENTFLYFALHQNLIPLIWPLQSLIYGISLNAAGKIITGVHHVIMCFILTALIFLAELIVRATPLSGLLCPGKPYEPRRTRQFTNK